MYVLLIGELWLFLLLYGYIDVVLVIMFELWVLDLFEFRWSGGWIYGCGVGDMKCGFVMGVFVLCVLCDVVLGFEGWLFGFLVVVEEECMGNGMLLVVR